MPKLKRLLRWLSIIFVIVLTIYFVVLPFGVGFVATRSAKESVGDPPVGFETLTLTTEDDIELGAWYIPPQNGAVILVVHGAGGSRKNMLSYAEMFVRHGFGVLLLDLRGHGESDGKTNQFGWAGTRDVGAAVRYIEQQPDVEMLGGLGSSLGAEVLLGAASTYPALKAIVSDGASYRSLDEFRALPEHQHFGVSFPYRIMNFSVGLFSGDEPPMPLLDSIKAADETQFLFIAAGKDSEEIDFNTYFAEAVGGTLWIVPDVEHTGGFSRHREEYEQRVIRFFEATLLEIIIE